jgi:hypothetical protein
MRIWCIKIAMVKIWFLLTMMCEFSKDSRCTSQREKYFVVALQNQVELKYVQYCKIQMKCQDYYFCVILLQTFNYLGSRVNLKVHFCVLYLIVVKYI